MAKERRKARNWTVGIALAALLAGGGVIAGTSLATTTLSASPAASTGSSGTGSSGSQAALLNAALNDAGSPNAAVTTSATGATGAAASAPGAGTSGAVAGPAARRCARAVGAARVARRTGHPLVARRAAGAAIVRCRFVRHRILRFFLLRGVDGQFTFRTRTGALKTVAYERGVIESVNGGSSIVVKAGDGTTGTWDLVSSTVVRDGGGKVSESTLAVGEPVWVGGPVVSGAKDARLIFVRPPSG